MAQHVPANMDGDGAATGRPPPQAWPDPKIAWYAVSVCALATMLLFLDRNIISLLVEPIKRDLQISDVRMSLLMGPAVVFFYALVAVPASRYVDRWRRNVILTAGIAVWSIFTAVCGLAQNFWQLFAARTGVGVGEIVHGPATYSLIADYFQRERLPRAIAVLQIGFIGGTGLSLLLGAFVIQSLMHVSNFQVPGTNIIIRNWQLVFFIVGLPGLLVAILMSTVPEPARRGRIASQPEKPIALFAVVKYLCTHWRLYAPQFGALAVAGIENSGTASWRVVFLQRTFDWSAPKAGFVLGLALLIAAPVGLWLATMLTEHFAKTRSDANLRVVAICYTLSPAFVIAGPLMPNPWLAVACASVTYLIQIGGAVPQNAAIQSVTPNEMRGQVTALYLFIFAVIGLGLGPTFIALFTDYLFADESMLRYSLASSAAIMLPIAAWIMWQGVKPYGEAIDAIKQREQAERA